MVLPFASIISKVFFCSLADRHRAYKLVFTCFLFTALLGYGSFGILPFFIDTPSKDRGLVLPIWIFICIMASTATISMSVVGSLSDAFAMDSSRKNNLNYGFIRVWGTLGWGIASLVLAYLNGIKQLPFLVPGLIMTIVLIVIDLLAVILWPKKSDFNLDKSASDSSLEDVINAITQIENRGSNIGSTAGDNSKTTGYGTMGDRIEMKNSQLPNVQARKTPSNLKLQWLLLKGVAKRRKSLFRYMVLFTCSGALIALQWSYLFLYLQKIYTESFTFISSLSMVGQAICGELPFFILSNVIIKRCGRSFTLSLSIMSLGLRYLLYRYLLPNSSMYFVLLTESLAGPSFGLFYVIMTEVGLEYSDCEDVVSEFVRSRLVENNPEEIKKLRQALRATMQSLMSACYEGLGVGIGSIVGGLVIDNFGFEILWTGAAITALFLGVANLAIDALKIPVLVDRRAMSSP